MTSWLLLAQSENTPSLRDVFTSIPAEEVFGGVVLILLIWMLIAGKVRLDREVEREKQVIEVHENTIEQQRETIRALTEKDRETLHLLRELRTAAIARGDLKFSEMIQEEMRHD